MTPTMLPILFRIFFLSMALVLLAACSSRPEVVEAVPEPAGGMPAAAEAWPEVRSPVPLDPEIETKIDGLLARMTLEEKVGQVIQAEIRHATPDDAREYHLGSILNGGGSFPNLDKHASLQDWLDLADAYYEASIDTSDGGLGIPLIWGTDAVHGHGNVIGATVFPHNIALGATHNPDLVRETGRVTAREVVATGIDWTFAPTAAVAQDDRWGRTYESYSEDPERVREMARALVLGLQGAPGTPEFLAADRVLATVKHYLADGGTLHGDDQGNAVISEEELRDIHSPGFAGAIEAGVQSAMASFSSWNGAKMHGNRYLLTDVLKERMGLDGFIIGDWNGHGQVPGCTNASCSVSFNAGLDVFMVVEEWKDLWHNTLAQVRSGEIPMERLDDAVRRVLRVKLRAGLFDRGRPSKRAEPFLADFGSAGHRAVARQAVRESLVLLKNAGGVLPIQPGSRVFVTGPAADDIGQQSGGWTISWQGTGNAKSDFPGGSSILDGLIEAVEAIGGTVEHGAGADYAERPDVAVVVFGEQPYAEYQGDRPTVEFEPGDKPSLALLESLRVEGVPVVAVFLSGRPLWVSQELNASDAFVAAWLPGSEGVGVADVLVGDAEGSPRHDFSGRLSFSWPRSPVQTPLNPHHEGYDPLFPLGYGLDYASGDTGPLQVEVVSDGVQGANADEIRLYDGRPLAPWAVFAGPVEGGHVMVSGSFITHPGGSVTVRAEDMDVQEDALTVEFSGSEPAHLSITGPGLDLRDYMDEGVVSFRVKADSAPAGKLELGVGEVRVEVADQLEPVVGAGWVDVAVPVSCFAEGDADLSAVGTAFSLWADKAAAVSFGDVRFLKSGEATLGCE